MVDDRAAFPHCDDLILHAPGECEFCDMYPERQQERIVKGVNFTGHNTANYPCPSIARRGGPMHSARRDLWHGNRAHPYEPKLP
jgi:hypothetical protein